MSNDSSLGGVGTHTDVHRNHSIIHFTGKKVKWPLGRGGDDLRVVKMFNSNNEFSVCTNHEFLGNIRFGKRSKSIIVPSEALKTEEFEEDEILEMAG